MGDAEAVSQAANQDVDEALAAFGLVADRPVITPRRFWLWPENRAVFELWQRLQTQWRVGMAGATGLSYPGVSVVMRHMGFRQGRADEAFALVQVMERAALTAWREKQS